MDLSHWVSSIVAFVRAGYPTGMPATGYAPLVASARRRPSNDETAVITQELTVQRGRPVNTADVGVAIRRVTNDMPSRDDVARVKHRLDAMGCRAVRRRMAR